MQPHLFPVPDRNPEAQKVINLEGIRQAREALRQSRASRTHSDTEPFVA